MGLLSLGQDAALDALEFSGAHDGAKLPHPEPLWQLIHFEGALWPQWVMVRRVVVGHFSWAARATDRAF